MAKNKVNDSGLENNVPEAIRCWYWCRSEINKFEKKQKRCAESIEAEVSRAKEQGYTDEEIQELIGTVTIPSWYLIVKNIDG